MRVDFRGIFRNGTARISNGIMLVSVVLNFQTIRFAPGNDLPYILYLPTYAATARYHGKLEGDVQFESFMDGGSGIRYGGLHDCADAREVRYQRISAPTLPNNSPHIRDSPRNTSNGRTYALTLRVFVRSSSETKVGQSDGSIADTKGIDRDSAGEMYEYDPSSAVVQGAYTAMLNYYVRDELEFASDLPYEILSRRVHPWDYGDHQNEYVNVADTLRKAMTTNPCAKSLCCQRLLRSGNPVFGIGVYLHAPWT